MEIAEELGVEAPWPQVCIIGGLLFLTVVEYSGIVDYFRNSYSKPKDNVNQSLIESEEGAQPVAHVHDHEDHHSIVVNGSVPILLAIILSIHSILESFSLGAAKEEDTQLSISIAIFAHRIFEAFALGSSCRVAAIELKKAIAGLLIFCFIGPTCVYIGYFVQSIVEGSASKWIEMIFQGIAAGTFLYLSIIEILIPEFAEIHHHEHAHSHTEEPATKSEEHMEKYGNLYKLLSLVMGAILMTIVGFFV